MIEKVIAHRLLQCMIGASFAVRFWDGTVQRYGSGTPIFTLIIRDPKIVHLIGEDDAPVRFGEAYMDGRVEVEGDVADFVALLIRNDDRIPTVSGGGLTGASAQWGCRSPERQKEDVATHYDLGNDFFGLWLDDSLTYSSAYFTTDSDTLEQAQRQKVDHSLRKLRLRPGETLLDIGCGWGALLMRAADITPGVRAVGITLSKEQYAAACAGAAGRGLDRQVCVEFKHYGALAREGRRFDKVVSIGMMEHVGKAHLGEFADALAALVKPEGMALLHLITSDHEGPLNAWMDKYIFPGAYIPSLPEVLRLLSERHFHVWDVENLGPHYRRTLDAWSERFEAVAETVRTRFGERFVRMWRLYLRCTSAGFREGTLEIHQILVSPGLPATLPLTRADLYAPSSR